MIVARVDKELCIGCGVCMEQCPMKAIDFDDAVKADVDINICVGCGACETACPMEAIKVLDTETETDPAE